jgi:hypothetical protein
MLNRTALLSATLATAFVVAGGVALTGLGQQQAQAAAPVAEPAVATTEAPADPAPVVQVDTVYLTPEGTPQVITTRVIKIAAAPHGDDDGEQEGEDD